MVSEITPCADNAQDNPVDAPIDVALLLRAAVEGVGCPHKVAAETVGYDASYWTRVLDNERGVVLERLGRLPRDVQRGLVTRWAAELGIVPTPGYEALADLADLIASRRVRITIESRE